MVTREEIPKTLFDFRKMDKKNVQKRKVKNTFGKNLKIDKIAEKKVLQRYYSKKKIIFL